MNHGERWLVATNLLESSIAQVEERESCPGRRFESFLMSKFKIFEMEPKGNVLIKREFLATKIWPNPQLTLKGMVDLEAEYKKALAGKMTLVLDIAVDDSGYLVYADSPTIGPFIWQIEKEDTYPDSFIPVYKKNGKLIPAGLSGIEQFIWMMNCHDGMNVNDYRPEDFEEMKL